MSPAPAAPRTTSACWRTTSPPARKSRSRSAHRPRTATPTSAARCARKAPHVSFLQEANKALRAIAAVARREELERLARERRRRAHAARTAQQTTLIERLRKRAGQEAAALNEFEVEGGAARLRHRDAARKQLVASLDEALRAAERIGYPVVLKAVSATLTHKSDAGAVALNLATPEQLRAAYERMTAKLAGEKLDGMLVGQFVSGGLELVLGLHRDREMGLIVMAGAGGVLLELMKDVAFCAPPVSREKALDLLARTQAGRLHRRATAAARRATAKRW